MADTKDWPDPTKAAVSAVAKLMGMGPVNFQWLGQILTNGFVKLNGEPFVFDSSKEDHIPLLAGVVSLITYIEKSAACAASKKFVELVYKQRMESMNNLRNHEDFLESAKPDLMDPLLAKLIIEASKRVQENRSQKNRSQKNRILDLDDILSDVFKDHQALMPQPETKWYAHLEAGRVQYLTVKGSFSTAVEKHLLLLVDRNGTRIQPDSDMLWDAATYYVQRKSTKYKFPDSKSITKQYCQDFGRLMQRSFVVRTEDLFHLMVDPDPAANDQSASESLNHSGGDSPSSNGAAEASTIRFSLECGTLRQEHTWDPRENHSLSSYLGDFNTFHLNKTDDEFYKEYTFEWSTQRLSPAQTAMTPKALGIQNKDIIHIYDRRDSARDEIASASASTSKLVSIIQEFIKHRRLSAKIFGGRVTASALPGVLVGALKQLKIDPNCRAAQVSVHWLLVQLHADTIKFNQRSLDLYFAAERGLLFLLLALVHYDFDQEPMTEKDTENIVLVEPSLVEKIGEVVLSLINPGDPLKPLSLSAGTVKKELSKEFEDGDPHKPKEGGVIFKELQAGQIHVLEVAGKRFCLRASFPDNIRPSLRVITDWRITCHVADWYVEALKLDSGSLLTDADVKTVVQTMESCFDVSAEALSQYLRKNYSMDKREENTFDSTAQPQNDLPPCSTANSVSAKKKRQKKPYENALANLAKREPADDLLPLEDANTGNRKLHDDLSNLAKREPADDLLSPEDAIAAITLCYRMEGGRKVLDPDKHSRALANPDDHGILPINYSLSKGKVYQDNMGKEVPHLTKELPGLVSATLDKLCRQRGVNKSDVKIHDIYKNLEETYVVNSKYITLCFGQSKEPFEAHLRNAAAKRRRRKLSDDFTNFSKANPADDLLSLEAANAAMLALFQHESADSKNPSKVLNPNLHSHALANQDDSILPTNYSLSKDRQKIIHYAAKQGKEVPHMTKELHCLVKETVDNLCVELSVDKSRIKIHLVFKTLAEHYTVNLKYVAICFGKSEDVFNEHLKELPLEQMPTPTTHSTEAGLPDGCGSYLGRHDACLLKVTIHPATADSITGRQQKRARRSRQNNLEKQYRLPQNKLNLMLKWSKTQPGRISDPARRIQYTTTPTATAQNGDWMLLFYPGDHNGGEAVTVLLDPDAEYSFIKRGIATSLTTDIEVDADEGSAVEGSTLAGKLKGTGKASFSLDLSMRLDGIGLQIAEGACFYYMDEESATKKNTPDVLLGKNIDVLFPQVVLPLQPPEESLSSTLWVPTSLYSWANSKCVPPDIQRTECDSVREITVLGKSFTAKHQVKVKLRLPYYFQRSVGTVTLLIFDGESPCDYLFGQPEIYKFLGGNFFNPYHSIETSTNDDSSEQIEGQDDNASADSGAVGSKRTRRSRASSTLKKTNPAKKRKVTKSKAPAKTSSGTSTKRKSRQRDNTTKKAKINDEENPSEAEKNKQNEEEAASTAEEKSNSAESTDPKQASQPEAEKDKQNEEEATSTAEEKSNSAESMEQEQASSLEAEKGKQTEDDATSTAEESQKEHGSAPKANPPPTSKGQPNPPSSISDGSSEDDQDSSAAGHRSPTHSGGEEGSNKRQRITPSEAKVDTSTTSQTGKDDSAVATLLSEMTELTQSLSQSCNSLPKELFTSESGGDTPLQKVLECLESQQTQMDARITPLEGIIAQETAILQREKESQARLLETYQKLDPNQDHILYQYSQQELQKIGADVAGRQSGLDGRNEDLKALKEGHAAITEAIGMLKNMIPLGPAVIRMQAELPRLLEKCNQLVNIGKENESRSEQKEREIQSLKLELTKAKSDFKKGQEEISSGKKAKSDLKKAQEDARRFEKELAEEREKAQEDISALKKQQQASLAKSEGLQIELTKERAKNASLLNSLDGFQKAAQQVAQQAQQVLDENK